MNSLPREDIHLLLDEPIYVLNEHFENKEKKPNLDGNREEIPNYKGENQKGILIVNNAENSDDISQDDVDFLFKGLNALGIYLVDVAIVNSNSTTTDYSKIAHSKRIDFIKKPVGKILYQIEVRDKVICLRCNSLNDIQHNQDLKVGFWRGLKTMFEMPAKI